MITAWQFAAARPRRGNQQAAKAANDDQHTSDAADPLVLLAAKQEHWRSQVGARWERSRACRKALEALNQPHRAGEAWAPKRTGAHLNREPARPMEMERVSEFAMLTAF